MHEQLVRVKDAQLRTQSVLPTIYGRIINPVNYGTLDAAFGKTRAKFFSSVL